MQTSPVGGDEPLVQASLADQFAQPAEPARLESQHGVVNGILAKVHPLLVVGSRLLPVQVLRITAPPRLVQFKEPFP